MDLMSFVNSHLWQHLDNGQGGYVGECVSLAIRVAHDVYSVPYGTLYCSNTGGARDLFEQFDGSIPQYFDKIANNPNDYNQLPQVGDFIIWGSSIGSFGHVGVVTNPNPLMVFQQLGTPLFKVSEIHTYPSYSGVLGWLRPKVAEVPVIPVAPAPASPTPEPTPAPIVTPDPVPTPVVAPEPAPVVVPDPTPNPVVETPQIAPEAVIAPEVTSVTVTSPVETTTITTAAPKIALIDKILAKIFDILKSAKLIFIGVKK